MAERRLVSFRRIDLEKVDQADKSGNENIVDMQHHERLNIRHYDEHPKLKLYDVNSLNGLLTKDHRRDDKYCHMPTADCYNISRPVLYRRDGIVRDGSLDDLLEFLKAKEGLISRQYTDALLHNGYLQELFGQALNGDQNEQNHVTEFEKV
jgi:hypothetical protein